MISIFTGLIEEIGKVQQIEPGAQSIKITIQAAEVIKDVKVGDSIAVNGVCLTVISFDHQHFTAEAMPETVKKTTLQSLQKGENLNLERALRLSDRLGGHLVQGHIDGIGIIVQKERQDIATLYTISATEEVMRYVVPKGSVAVDGVSLTVVEDLQDRFIVSLIPHTAHKTVLGNKKPGDTVNLESDIIGRYVDKLLKPSEHGAKEAMSLGFLAENGFL